MKSSSIDSNYTKVPTKSYKRVYVWELPVRVFHWINALCIVVLGVTGFIIADPPALLSQHEAWETFTFAKVKVVHFITAYIFVGTILMRVYWSFVGNQYAHWSAFIPLTKKARKNIVHVLKHDIFLMKDPRHRLSDISIGHNFLASTTYFIMFFVALVLIFTGFGLYSGLSAWWFPNLFAWVPSFLGGDFLTRQIHHFSMWIVIFFIIIHVYLALFHDWLHARGEVSTIISGFKFVRTERVKQEEIKTGETVRANRSINMEVDYEDEDEYSNEE